MVRVNPIDKSLCPRLVVLREDCVELFDREKPVEVRVGALFKELPPCGLLWAPRPFFIPCALSTDVVVAEEAVEPVVAVVGLGEDLAAGGTCVTVPGPLPASEADYLSKKKKSSLFFLFSKEEFSHLWPESQLVSTLAEDVKRLRHCFQFRFPARCVSAHSTVGSVVPQKVVDLVRKVNVSIFWII